MTITPKIKIVAKAKVKLIEELVYSGNQSREYRWIAQLTQGKKAYKVKIDIDRDSINSQSSAVGMVWKESDLKWERVYSIPTSQMATLLTIQAYGKEGRSGFLVDKGTIQTKLEEILF